jgi:hypothetical protein
VRQASEHRLVQQLGIMEQAHHTEDWLAGPIEASMCRITVYDAQIEQAKHDQAHVNATLRLFTDVEKQRARYVVSHGFFRKGEIADLCALQL